MSRKFKFGDLVRLYDEDHDPSTTCDAIVVGSYDDRLEGKLEKHTNIYPVYIKGYGFRSWFEGNRMELIESCRIALITQWEEERLTLEQEREKNRTPVSFDVADCCISMEEAKDLIRRREKYAKELVEWVDRRMDNTDFKTTLAIVKELLRPLCGRPINDGRSSARMCTYKNEKGE